LRSMRYSVGCARKVRVLERKARLSHLALPEMLRLFFVSGLVSYRHRHGVNEGCSDRGPLTVSVALGRIAATRQDTSYALTIAAFRQLGDIRRNPSRLIFAVGCRECGVRGTTFVPASYFQLSDGPKSRSSFCRVSRSDSQYRTNKSGPATRKSCSTARRQKGLRPLSQACPSGGNRGKIDSSKMEFGVSVVFLSSASFCGSVGLNSSATRLVRSSIGVTLFSQSTVTALSVRA
jgi:hypothetical protein